MVYLITEIEAIKEKLEQLDAVIEKNVSPTKHIGHLLIVDDDAALRALIIHKFSGIGFSIEAATVKIAKERLYETVYDLIILDLAMAPESGYVFFEFMKSDPKFKWIPLIVLSGHNNIDEKVKCLDLGADDYVTKPFEFKELNARASRIIKRAREFEQMAFRDALTDVYNRRYFENQLTVDLQRIQRSNEPLSLAILDIDKFILVNDTYGHPIGDQVLQGLAHLLKENLRKTDYVARFGGEEFIVVFDKTSEATAAQIMNELLKKVWVHMMAQADDIQIFITFSAGIAGWQKGLSKIKWLDRADQLLYHAKHSGRNQCVAWGDQLIGISNGALQTDRILRVLIADDDKMMHAILSSKLTELSFQIISAVDGEEAFTILQEQDIDLCILDIIMPKLTGFELLQQLRAISKNKDIKVFIITGHSSEYGTEEALQRGADEYMAKPFSIVEFEMRLKRLMFTHSK